MQTLFGGFADPIIAEQEEYKAQLAHADDLIDELVDERDRLKQERDQLRQLLGVQNDHQIASSAHQLRLVN